jgi:cystathionine beta-lyase/cystathionine gamma-synthase
MRDKEFETKAIHSKPEDSEFYRAINTPIFQSSTYKYGERAEYDDIRYARLNNSPNHHVLHHRLADLEKAEAALVTSSGMSAISTALLAVLSKGDHLLMQNCVYGGTYGFVMQDLPRFGIEVDFFDASDAKSLATQIKLNTRAIYLESISNPMMRVPAFAEIVNLAQAKKIVTLIDNTYATPYNFQPARVGIDISLHSCSKQINGHSDVIAGAVIGKNSFITPITKMLNKLGGCLDPHACFLLERGMKTLGLRVKQQN